MDGRVHTTTITTTVVNDIVRIPFWVVWWMIETLAAAFTGHHIQLVTLNMEGDIAERLVIEVQKKSRSLSGSVSESGRPLESIICAAFITVSVPFTVFVCHRYHFPGTVNSALPPLLAQAQTHIHNTTAAKVSRTVGDWRVLKHCATHSFEECLHCNPFWI